jgi:hypothetical protein
MQSHKTIGLGDPKKIAIAMNGHGIGDDISAMPAIAQKISEGYDITVFCKGFSQKCWTSLGCKVCPSVSDKGEEFFKFGAFIGETFEGNWEVINLKNEFGVIYELPQWSVMNSDSGNVFYRNRIHAFAELIETTVPESFSWVDALRPQKKLGEYVLFAPDSASTNRTFVSQKRLYTDLKKRFQVVVFGQHALYHKGKKVALPRFGKKDRLRVAFSKIKTVLANKAIALWNKNIDRDKFLCSTFDEFLAYIYSAKFVVATDNGVMNTARALSVPCIAVFGSTPQIAATQYDKFNKTPREIIKCESSEKGIDISDNIDFILERTTQWQRQHIMA